jgi:cell division protein ZapA (FtsZ GTPase activity inhibitor)
MPLSLFGFKSEKLQAFFQSLVEKRIAKMKKNLDGDSDKKIEVYEIDFQYLEDDELQVIRGLGICDEIVRLVEQIKLGTKKLKDEIRDEETNNLSLLQF